MFALMERQELEEGLKSVADLNFESSKNKLKKP